MRLYLVRHPAPQIASGICYGSSDLVVAPDELARVLSALLTSLPRGVPLFSSPLQRCAQLAVHLHAGLGASVLSWDARLVEMDFGSWELRSWDAIPRDEIDAWSNDVASYQAGGGESVWQMAQRVRAFYDDLKNQQSHQNDSAIVLCHAGTIRLLMACQRGLSLTEMAHAAAQTSNKIAYGETVILNC